MENDLGHCVAGGMELAAWCDLRVAHESAIFGIFCRSKGDFIVSYSSHHILFYSVIIFYSIIFNVLNIVYS